MIVELRPRAACEPARNASRCVVCMTGAEAHSERCCFMARRTPGRTFGVVLAAVAGLFALSACSADGVPADIAVVQEAVLLPQTLFPGGGVVTECPEPPKDAPKDSVGGVPKAVCITVENTGDDRAVYTVNAEVQTRDDEPITLAPVTITTQPIEPGAVGSAAAAAPGSEKAIDEYADGQKEAQQASGLYASDDVQILIRSVTRQPA
jgi:hypothetical protein